MDGADLGKVKVEAVVAEHVKGPKIRVNTYRPEEALSSAAWGTGRICRGSRSGR